MKAACLPSLVSNAAPRHTWAGPAGRRGRRRPLSLAFAAVVLAVGATGLFPVGEARAQQPQALFFDDFEGGAGKWQIPGSMVITTASAFSGQHSQTFATTRGGGDAFTSFFPVSP